jgi:hypothetical protein
MYSKKKIFSSKTTIYLQLGLLKERPSYKRSLQLSKENFKHPGPNSEYGSGFRIRIRIPNMDPLTRLNPDPYSDPQPLKRQLYNEQKKRIKNELVGLQRFNIAKGRIADPNPNLST